MRQDHNGWINVINQMNKKVKYRLNIWKYKETYKLKINKYKNYSNKYENIKQNIVQIYIKYNWQNKINKRIKELWNHYNNKFIKNKQKLEH